MKYQQLVSMPAALQDWLGAELESRGIDAVAYTRYILSLFQTDVLEPQEDLFSLAGGKHSAASIRCKERFREKFQECSVSGRKARRRHKREENRLSWDGEQLKRCAAVECLMSASEQKCGIEKLVDELCAKLKSIQSEGVGESNSHLTRTPLTMTSDESGAETDGYVSSTPEEQAEKYYAAFPPLSDHSDSTVSSMAVMLNSNSVWYGRKILTDSFGKNKEEGKEGDSGSQENVKDSKDDQEKEWVEENKENREEQKDEGEEGRSYGTNEISFIVPKVRNGGRQRAAFLRAKPGDMSSFTVLRNSVLENHSSTEGHFELDCTNDDSAVEDGDSDSSPCTRQLDCASERGLDTPEGYIGDTSSRESSEDRDRCAVQKEKEIRRENLKEKVEMKEKRSKEDGKGNSQMMPLKPKLRLYQRRGSSSSSLENSDQDLDCCRDRTKSKMKNGKEVESDEKILAQLIAKFNSEVAAIWDQVSAWKLTKYAEDISDGKHADGYSMKTVELPSFDSVNPLTPNIGLLSSFLSPAKSSSVEEFSIGRQKLQDFSVYIPAGTNICNSIWSEGPEGIDAKVQQCLELGSNSIWSEEQEGTEVKAQHCSGSGSLNQSLESEPFACDLSDGTGVDHSLEILNQSSDGSHPEEFSSVPDHLLSEKHLKSPAETTEEEPSAEAFNRLKEELVHGEEGEDSSEDELENSDEANEDAGYIKTNVLQVVPDDKTLHIKLKAIWDKYDADSTQTSTGNFSPSLKPHEVYWEVSTLNTVESPSSDVLQEEMCGEPDESIYIMEQMLGTMMDCHHKLQSPASMSDCLEGLNTLFPNYNSQRNSPFTSKKETDSFGALNHQEDVSSFTQVVPHTKAPQLGLVPFTKAPQVERVPDVKAADEEIRQNLTCTFETLKIQEDEKASQEMNYCDDDDDDDDEENLLTSPRTHFRPIRQESQETSNSSDHYEDGTVFNIEHNDEKLVFTRSESGALYLHNEIDPGDSPKKYMVYKQKMFGNIELDEYNGLVSEDMDVGSLPKFRVKQNEKFCQTDLDSGLDEEEDGFLDDIEDIHRVQCSENEANQETAHFFFPFDSLQSGGTYPQEGYHREVGGPVTSTSVTSHLEAVSATPFCDHTHTVHGKHTNMLGVETDDSSFKVSDSMASLLLQNYRWRLHAEVPGNVPDYREWQLGLLHSDWTSHEIFDEVKTPLYQVEQKENNFPQDWRREILSCSWKECNSENWMSEGKIDGLVGERTAVPCSKEQAWEEMQSGNQKELYVAGLKDKTDQNWKESLQDDKLMMENAPQETARGLEEDILLLEDSTLWMEPTSEVKHLFPEKWCKDLELKNPEEKLVFSEDGKEVVKGKQTSENMNWSESEKSGHVKDLPQEGNVPKLALEKWKKDLEGLELTENSLRQWYIPWSEGTDAKQPLSVGRAVQPDATQVYLQTLLSKKVENKESNFSQSNQHSRLRDEIAAEGEQLVEDIHLWRRLDLASNWVEEDMNDLYEWLPEEEVVPSESQEFCGSVETIGDIMKGETVEGRPGVMVCFNENGQTMDISLEFQEDEIFGSLEPKGLEDLTSSEVPAMPTSGKIMYSTELEEQWKKIGKPFKVQVPNKERRSKRLPACKRPCSFYMDGNCHRTRCKFSHDLSTITCRFWEEGSCFKGITCPFLHGYPSALECSETSENEKGFTLDSESDFPALVLMKELKPHSSHGVPPKAELGHNGTKRKKCRFPRYAGCELPQERRLCRRERRISHTSSEETSDTKEYIRSGKGGKSKKLVMSRRLVELRKNLETKTLCRKLNCRGLQKKEIEENGEVKDT